MFVLEALSEAWKRLHRGLISRLGRRHADQTVVFILLVLPLLLLVVPGIGGGVLGILGSLAIAISVICEVVLRVVGRGSQSLGGVLQQEAERSKRGQLVALFATYLASIAVTFGVAFASLERLQQGKHLVSGVGQVNLIDALYFSVATATTVGFGDIYPKSVAAKLLTIAEMCSVFLVVVVALGTVLGVVGGKRKLP